MGSKYRNGKYRISVAGCKEIQNKPASIIGENGDDVLGGGGASNMKVLSIDTDGSKPIYLRANVFYLIAVTKARAALDIYLDPSVAGVMPIHRFIIKSEYAFHVNFPDTDVAYEDGVIEPDTSAGGTFEFTILQGRLISYKKYRDSVIKNG